MPGIPPTATASHTAVRNANKTKSPNGLRFPLGTDSASAGGEDCTALIPPQPQWCQCLLLYRWHRRWTYAQLHRLRIELTAIANAEDLNLKPISQVGVARMA